MKEVKVQIPDDKELVWDEDLNAYTLVDMIDVEAREIFNDFQSDINRLYAKYRDRLVGKVSINANIRFTAYCDGNRHKTQHLVSNTSVIDVIKGEKCWHD